MADPWQAERQLDTQQVEALLRAGWPELADQPVRPVAEGWDNAVFRVGEDLLLRLPRREVAVELARHELIVLPLLAGQLPLPVPEPLLVGEHRGWPFFGYRALAGRTGDVAAPDDAARVAGAAALGRFLAALHGSDTAAARAAGLPGDRWRRLDLAHRVERLQPRLERALAGGLLDDRAPLDALCASLPPVWRPRDDVLVHGDLYSRNLLVDDAGQPCGVIDWGDVHLGDPAVDLSVGLGWVPPAGRDAFRAAYGPVDGDRWTVARFRAAHHAIALGLYGLDVDDPVIVAESRRTLDLALLPD